MKIMIRVAALILVLDQLSKYLVVRVLDLRSALVIDVLPPFVTFRMAWNQGINFGLFADDGELVRWILIAIAVVIAVWVALWVRKERMGPLAQIAAGLLIGGAAGNSLDRLIYGAVADFLNITCCGINNPFAFNVADISIFAGALGLIFFASEKKAA
ncbi:MAG: signal peptidase II [Paracoccaceae bacterium]